MSNALATPTTRFTPPSEPTRKPAPRRTLASRGSVAVVGADRPMLRIVADDEPAPLLARVAPASLERVVSVELGAPVASSQQEVEAAPRPVRLDAFFAAEYDGDDQRLQVAAAPRRSSVRLTRRGRLVVLIAGLLAALGLGLYAASVSTASDHPEQTRMITVQPGQTLWDISAKAAAGGDIRSMMSHLEAINHLDSSALQVGQHLRVPR